MVKGILFIDTNLGLEFARRTAKDGYKTYFAVVNAEPYPHLENTITGYGFEDEGVIKIDDYGDALEEVDTIVFTDVGFGGLADYLRTKGYYVFGADEISENLELDRVYAKRTLEKYGIPQANYKIVKGVEGVLKAIEEITKKGKKAYVKINKVRGSIETFGTYDPHEAKVLLDQAGFSVISDVVEFVVEEQLEGVEVGIDTFFNGKDFQPIVFETIELKGAGNITKAVRYEDSIWYENLEKLKPYFQRNGYRGMICFEGFYDGSKVYIIDPTMRFPYICGYAYPKWLTNFSEVLIGTAKGELVEPKPRTKYSTQIGVYTDNPDIWREIHIKDEIKDKVAFRRVIKKGGKFWFVPGDYVVAVGIGEGNTWEASIDDASKVVNGISAFNTYEQSGVLREYFKSAIEKLKELGYEF